MRVADFAKDLGLTSADLMGILDNLGITVVSDASKLQESQVGVVRAHLAARAAMLEATQSEPEPEPASAVVEISDRPVAPAVRAETSPVAEPPVEDEWLSALSATRRPILLWGPPGSGKSTFLAGMMFRQADDDLDPYDWRIMSVGARAGDYVRSVLQAYRAGAQPNATLVTDAPFRFKIRKVRKHRRWLGVVSRPEAIRMEADLLLVDPPGELFTVSRMRSRTGVRLLELMENAAGMLLLIDPTFGDPEDGDIARQRRYWTMLVENLSEIVHHLKRRGPDVQHATLDEENRLRIPTAICITKMDQHPADAHRPAEFLREQIGEATFALIENSFSNYAVYACSALGNEARMTPEGVRLPGNPKPWGVVDPIRWILEESMHTQGSQVFARFGW